MINMKLVSYCSLIFYVWINIIVKIMNDKYKQTLLCKLYRMQSSDTCGILVEVVCFINLAKCVYHLYFLLQL